MEDYIRISELQYWTLRELIELQGRIQQEVLKKVSEMNI